MKNKKAAKKSSSQIIGNLFGDTEKFRKVMRAVSKELSISYKNKNLNLVFDNLENKFICICPMVSYSSLMRDLGKKPDDKILKAIGLMNLAISTHDDVVDEMPEKREVVSRLIYAGNIAGLEGVRLLASLGKNSLLEAISAAINKNHYFQQIVVEELWDQKQVPNREKYFKGIFHITTFIRIGLVCALAEAERLDLLEKIEKFSIGYGYALQLVDDIREVDDDRLCGYKSFPMREGKTYSISKKIAKENLIKARKVLDSKWINMNRLVDKMEIFFEKEI